MVRLPFVAGALKSLGERVRELGAKLAASLGGPGPILKPIPIRVGNGSRRPRR